MGHTAELGISLLLWPAPAQPPAYVGGQTCQFSSTISVPGLDQAGPKAGPGSLGGGGSSDDGPCLSWCSGTLGGHEGHFKQGCLSAGNKWAVGHPSWGSTVLGVWGAGSIWVDRTLGPLLSAARPFGVGGLACLPCASVSPGTEGGALGPPAAPPSTCALRLGRAHPFPGGLPAPSLPPICPCTSIHYAPLCTGL